MSRECIQTIRPMQLPTTSDNPSETPTDSPKRDAITEPDFNRPVRLISEFAGHPDFPKCALGEHVDVGGFVGVLVAIVNQSIKVKPPEGLIQSFNIYRLKKIYGPVVPPVENDLSKSAPESRPAPAPAPVVAETVETPEPPPREVVEEPDFDQEIKALRVFANRSDFPKCVLGEYVDIRGYAGVVVEIVNKSIKVKCPEGLTRSYNVDGLRRLFGEP